MSRFFLLEIGCEEIPARMIPAALKQLREGFQRELERQGIPPAGVKVYGTPRRLAVSIPGLPEHQPDTEVLVAGPAVSVAYDSQGKPTRAAIGFARAQGVPVQDLSRVERSQGEQVAVRKKVRGRETAEILLELAPRLIASLNFPITMRWGTEDERFARPVRWVVALLNSRVLPLTWAGVKAGSWTRGHRRKGSPRIRLSSASAYLNRLRREGILLDPSERRFAIEKQLHAAAKQAGGEVVADPDLLETVTYLVESPLVIPGSFRAEFLQLPEEVLRTALRFHQKCFSLRGSDGKLRHSFLAMADADSDPEGIIRRGNEWVLAARLADARFFWMEDRKTPLQERSGELQRVTFHKDLGSYGDKVERMLVLCREFAEATGASPEDLEIACRLAKCDLTSRLVGEFPELQGILGGLYAREEGYPRAASEAIYDHYLPRSLEDACPRGAEGALLGIVDRLDTLTGFFLLGQTPSGSRDPFGLRRAALGICKIALERKLEISLDRLVERSLGLHRIRPPSEDLPGIRAKVLSFLRERLAYILVSRGFPADTVEAALRCGAENPIDSYSRVSALEAIRTDRDFEALAIGFKRVRNILQGQPEAGVHPDRFQEPAEKDLHLLLESVKAGIEKPLQERDYPAVLRQIATMRASIDRFFDQVLVMAKEEATRRNRIGLLQGISRLFLRIADFSCMDVGDPS